MGTIISDNLNANENKCKKVNVWPIDG